MRLEATVEISAHRFFKPSCALKSPAKCDAGVGILPSSESCLICLGCSLGPEILRAPQLILMCGQSWKFWPNCLKCKWGNGDPKYINAPYAQGQLSTGLGLDLGHLAANLMLSPQHAWCPSARNAGGPTLGREKEAAGLTWLDLRRQGKKMHFGQPHCQGVSPLNRATLHPSPEWMGLWR